MRFGISEVRAHVLKHMRQGTNPFKFKHPAAVAYVKRAITDLRRMGMLYMSDLVNEDELTDPGRAVLDAVERGQLSSAQLYALGSLVSIPAGNKSWDMEDLAGFYGERLCKELVVLGLARVVRKAREPESYEPTVLGVKEYQAFLKKREDEGKRRQAASDAKVPRGGSVVRKRGLRRRA